MPHMVGASWIYNYLGLLSTCWLGWLFFSGIELLCCLYILEISSLSVVPFAIFFFCTEGCLFTLHIVSFVVQKLLSYLGLICLFLLFNSLGFNHVPSSAGCFSVISFCLIYCLWSLSWLKGYSSCYLWSLPLLSGVWPMPCEGFLVGGICVCVLVSGARSCVSEGQWLGPGWFGASMGSVWLWAAYLPMFRVVPYLAEG